MIYKTVLDRDEPQAFATRGRASASERLPRKAGNCIRAAVKSAGLRVECGLFEFSRGKRVADIAVNKSLSEWIDFLYGPIFRVIGFFYRVYTANRARFERFKQNAGIATALRALAMLMLVGWLLVWYFAPDDSRDRLSDEIRKTFGADEQVESNDQ